jgi:adenylate cyclase
MTLLFAALHESASGTFETCRGRLIDCRPLQCFMAMRDELSLASSELEREFGAVPRIRGSLHFGAVIVGEIGDIKRAIVFNGDVRRCLP